MENTNIERLTKKDYFEIIKGILETSADARKDACIAMIDKEIYLLNNKKSKGTAKMKAANDQIANVVLEVLEEAGRPMTVSEMLLSPRLETYEKPAANDTFTIERMTGQKLSSIVTGLLKNGAVIRTVEKKRAYFSLPVENE